MINKMPVSTIIRTVPERCKMCYTCVRECPAKAIRISNGQAEIVAARCIACGNCVRVCSQGAKEVVSSIDRVDALMTSSRPVCAVVASSFPAEFTDIRYQQLVGMMRALGFDAVHEIAFGADLVAVAYSRLLIENPDRHTLRPLARRSSVMSKNTIPKSSNGSRRSYRR